MRPGMTRPSCPRPRSNPHVDGLAPDEIVQAILHELDAKGLVNAQQACVYVCLCVYVNESERVMVCVCVCVCVKE